MSISATATCNSKATEATLMAVSAWRAAAKAVAITAPAHTTPYDAYCPVGDSSAVDSARTPGVSCISRGSFLIRGGRRLGDSQGRWRQNIREKTYVMVRIVLDGSCFLSANALWRPPQNNPCYNTKRQIQVLHVWRGSEENVSPFTPKVSPFFGTLRKTSLE